MLKKLNILFVILLTTTLFSVTNVSAESNANVIAEEDLPTTGFEDRDGESWTTLEEEAELFEQLEQMSDRIRVTEHGESVLGEPIWLVRVTNGEHRTDEEIANGRKIFVMGTPHGNEPAGRDASLSFIRDLAFTDDPEMLDLLDEATILFTPTSNPDGRAANTRGNATGLDNNRDNLNLTSPEGQTLAKTLNYFKPEITLDLHERSAEGAQVQILWPRNLNLDNTLHDFNQSMIEDYVMPYLEEAGWTSELYGTPGGAGGEDERILRNTGGLRHGLSILVESYSRGEMTERVQVQRDTTEAVIRFWKEKFDEIPGIMEGSRVNRAADGIDPTVPFYLDGADNWPPTMVLEKKPMGYLLTDEQANDVTRHLELFSIQNEEVNNGVFVSMNQPMMTVVPLLFDERAKYNEISALPLYSLPNPGTASNMKNQVNHFINESAFSSDADSRKLTMHLTAVAIYEEKGQANKVIKHMETFDLMLDHMKDNEGITDEAFNNLKTYSEFLITKWQ